MYNTFAAYAMFLTQDNHSSHILSINLITNIPHTEPKPMVSYLIVPLIFIGTAHATTLTIILK